MLEACKEAGVAAPIYVSAGFDEKYAVEHPEDLHIWSQDGKAPEVTEKNGVKYFDSDKASYHLLCMNFYLNMPLSQFLTVFAFSKNADTAPQAEVFLDNSSELLEEAVCEVRKLADQDRAIRPSLKNRYMIRELYKKGIFNIKNAVDYVADQLGISKNTVYMHLRYVKEENQELA